MILPSYIYGQNTSWIDTLYARIPNLNSLFYAFADHPYWYGHDPAEDGGNGPFERIETLRARMIYHGAGSKPIDITEYGESTASLRRRVRQRVGPGPAPAGDAECGRQPQGLGNRDVPRLPASRPRHRKHAIASEQFGLLREDGTPKPAYSILRSAMQQYRG